MLNIHHVCNYLIRKFAVYTENQKEVPFLYGLVMGNCTNKLEFDIFGYDTNTLNSGRFGKKYHKLCRSYYKNEKG